MKRAMLTMDGATERLGRSPPVGAAALPLLAVLLLGSGCISVKAPEKPIEINLNVNIKQEVVVSLRQDVKDLDQKYPGVF